VGSRLLLARGLNSPLWGDQNLGRITRLGRTSGSLYCHLLDFIDTTFNTEYMAHWTAHYGGPRGPGLPSILTYIGQRRSYVLSCDPRRDAPFAITTNGGSDFTVDAASTLIEGNAWFDVKSILVDRVAERSTSNGPRRAIGGHGAAQTGSESAHVLRLRSLRNGRRIGHDHGDELGGPAGSNVRPRRREPDGSIDLTDVVKLLFHPHLGASVSCQDARDANNNEVL
jgi:hypothetical protein